MNDDDLGQLLKRVQKIEDIQAIKDLKCKYARACDDGYNTDTMGEIFTENAVFDAGDEWGRHEGLSAIQDFFRESSKVVSMAVHYFVQPEITLADGGTTASATWYLWQACTVNDEAMWLSGLEHDKYVKIGGRWWQSEMKLDLFFFSPFEEGWNKPIETM